MGGCLSVDIGGSKVIVGLVSDAGKVISSAYKSFPERYDRESLLHSIKELAGQLDLQGIEIGGVTVPGLADPEKGLWLSSPFTGISAWDIAGDLQAALGVPFFAENDVNACAVAERQFGLCKDKPDFLWITMSNGVGGAVYLNGSLLRGRNLGAGEVGHIVVEEDGPVCCCGNRGCLEAIASGRGISASYLKYTGETKTAQEIAKLAEAGEPAAKAAYDRAAKGLGKAISYAANLMNIETFIFGGGVAQSMHLLAPGAMAQAEKSVLHTATKNIRIGYTALGYHAALIGGAAVALEMMHL